MAKATPALFVAVPKDRNFYIIEGIILKKVARGSAKVIEAPPKKSHLVGTIVSPNNNTPVNLLN
ncbi:MAG: hypothetical protein WCK48_00525 [bacterium]